MIAQEQLKELFEYREDLGELEWIKTGKGKRLNGAAGTVTNHGYKVITIEGNRYLEHRLVWLYFYGSFPSSELDHIDGDPLNNRIENLREVSHSENLANAKTRSDNTSGQKGVCWDKQKNKWKVQIGPAGGRIQRHFVDLEEAKSFARNVSTLVFGEYARAF